MAEMNEETVDEEVVAEETPVAPVVDSKPDKPAKAKKETKKDGKIVKFFRDTVSEMKKVVWTPKEEVKKTTLVVVVAVVVFATVFGIIDVAGASLVDLLAGLVK